MKAPLVVVLREILSEDCKIAFRNSMYSIESMEKIEVALCLNTWLSRKKKKNVFPFLTALAHREDWIALEHLIQFQVKNKNKISSTCLFSVPGFGQKQSIQLILLNGFLNNRSLSFIVIVQQLL